MKCKLIKYMQDSMLTASRNGQLTKEQFTGQPREAMEISQGTGGPILCKIIPESI